MNGNFLHPIVDKSNRTRSIFSSLKNFLSFTQLKSFAATTSRTPLNE
ncbi:MAG: hypothetical protein JJP05_01535 [cyanobacterium endosymbiont of Rhopalodia gibba]